MIDIRFTNLRVRVYDPIATMEARDAARPVVVDLTRQVLNMATVLCPVRTGYLRAHHAMSVTTTATGVRGDVTNSASYAAIVHDGSRRRVGRPWMTRAAEVVAASNGAHFER
jgi:hypothetical protein